MNYNLRDKKVISQTDLRNGKRLHNNESIFTNKKREIRRF